MRNILWRMLRALFFLRDAESAHHSMLRLIRHLHRKAPALLRVTSGVPVGGMVAESSCPVVFGMPFLSRVGLAAGFDKNSEIVSALPDLGFGFAEIGTVTPRPQPGNEPPRLFRDVRAHTLFNRMGFNNSGAEYIAGNLKLARAELPSFFRVGVNVGKNRDTPAEQAADDYAKAAKAFVGLADFFVINVSSPNTPGLRLLQTEDALKAILSSVLEATASAPAPVLVKLAPELGGEDLQRALVAGDAAGASGWVLTNTLAGSWAQTGAIGGSSGSVLTQIARARLVEARQMTARPIISVGGIMNEEEAALRRKLGADLVQVYSGWVFGGPALPMRLSKAIQELQIRR
ncbi:MAG: dihydroorotate dehydrogenase (quinone) [Bdellovibrionales bacterium GWB1_55_8]|nr:MAG: dihydroorotate dehydrogenase (quinone) [Bdellovibrionales bacterium GWB1_55_8]